MTEENNFLKNIKDYYLIIVVKSLGGDLIDRNYLCQVTFNQQTTKTFLAKRSKNPVWNSKLVL